MKGRVLIHTTGAGIALLMGILLGRWSSLEPSPEIFSVQSSVTASVPLDPSPRVPPASDSNSVLTSPKELESLVGPWRRALRSANPEDQAKVWPQVREVLETGDEGEVATTLKFLSFSLPPKELRSDFRDLIEPFLESRDPEMRAYAIRSAIQIEIREGDRERVIARKDDDFLKRHFARLLFLTSSDGLRGESGQILGEKIRELKASGDPNFYSYIPQRFYPKILSEKKGLHPVLRDALLDVLSDDINPVPNAIFALRHLDGPSLEVSQRLVARLEAPDEALTSRIASYLYEYAPQELRPDLARVVLKSLLYRRNGISGGMSSGYISAAMNILQSAQGVEVDQEVLETVIAETPWDQRDLEILDALRTKD